MKRTLLTLAVMAVALLAAKPDAQAGDGAKMVKPGLALLLARGSLVVLDARRQVGWCGPARPGLLTRDPPAILSCPKQGRLKPASASYASYETAEREQRLAARFAGQSYCPPTYSGYSSGAGSNYAGYGWTWGPGTANRDSRRPTVLTEGRWM